MRKEGQCGWSIVTSVKEAGIRGGWRDKKVMVRLLLINKCPGYSYIFMTSSFLVHMNVFCVYEKAVPLISLLFWIS